MDAGGNGRVTKRRKVYKKKREVRGDGDEEIEGEEEAEESQEGQVSAKVFKDARANRRVAFENDFEFLAESTTPGSSNPPLQPSSDFLKCIHHLASRYYASSGRLIDGAAQYRKVKKEKRRQRILQAEASTFQNAGSSDVAEESHHGAEDDSMEKHSRCSKSKAKGKGKAKAKVTRTKVTQRDMYKAFDGSALLCIGMLLQSHILSSLPTTWGLDASEEDVVTDDVIVDPALLHSGRLDRKIEFPLPNECARARILEIHSRKMAVGPDVNFEEIARSTVEFNGAELKAVCVEAGMIALREGATKLGHEHFHGGIAQVQAKKNNLLYFA